MFSYAYQLDLPRSTMPFWIEGLISMMDTLGIEIVFQWPLCRYFQSRDSTSPSSDTAHNHHQQQQHHPHHPSSSSSSTQSTPLPLTVSGSSASDASDNCWKRPWRWRSCCSTTTSTKSRRRRKTTKRRMLRFQPRRWMSMARRRPLMAISILGLLAFISVYVSLGEENYDKIGIEMLAEKERILQEINDDLTKSQPMDDRQIFQMDQYERRNRIRMVCETRDKDKSSGLINNLITTNYNLTYCVIPRSDNTFWLQVLRYLHHDYTQSQPQSPFQLDVDQVHSRPFGKTRMHTWRLLTEEQRQVILNTRIFMSVQDPYMRLWTTYIHALVLPEMWETVGARIYQRRPKVTRRKGLVCAHDVTFGEFVTYVLDSYEKDFAPYYYLCDPCRLNPYYTVKAESAHRDNGYILEHFKLDHVVKGEGYQDGAVVNAINFTIQTSYKKFQAALRGGCKVDLLTLNLRLWKTFVMEGIVPHNATQPNLNDVSQSQLVDIMVRAYRDGLARGVDSSSKKRLFMAAAYRNLDPAILESLEERYKMDFRLFSYDSHPHDIFGGV